MSQEYENCRNHVMQKINEAVIEEEPFPHMVIEGIFPDSLYSELMNDINKIEGWDVFYRPDKKSNKRTREQIFLAKEILGDENNKWFDFKGMSESVEMSESLNKISWGTVRNIVRSHEVSVALLKKFEEYLGNRIAGKNLDEMHLDVTLNRDREGFKINPHTDTEGKLLFGIFYFAPDNKHQNLSTSLYIHKKGLKSWRTTPTGIKLLPEDFEKVKDITYTPNKLVIMLKNDSSWHGVDVPYSGVLRHTIYYSIWDY